MIVTHDLVFSTPQGEKTVRKTTAGKMTPEKRARIKSAYLDRRGWTLLKVVGVAEKKPGK